MMIEVLLPTAIEQKETFLLERMLNFRISIEEGINIKQSRHCRITNFVSDKKKLSMSLSLYIMVCSGF